MKTKFYKLTALGNDYVYFENFSQNLDINKIIKKTDFISNRRFGIGGDGTILVLKSDSYDAKMRIFNADKSEAEMCGNGLRSVIKLLNILNPQKKIFSVETMAGIMKGEIKEKGIIKIKLASEPNISDKIEKVFSVDKEFDFYRANIGNPHAIIFVNNVQNFDVQKYGKPIENNLKLFKNRTNIEFIKEIEKGIVEMRVWERGSRETLACGTGAACVAGVYKKVCAKNLNKIKIRLLGGDLDFEWKDEKFFMYGSANYVFEGVIDI